MGNTSGDGVLALTNVGGGAPTNEGIKIVVVGGASNGTYPQALLGLNGLPTLQQRVGNRYWAGNGVWAVSKALTTAWSRASRPPARPITRTS